MGYTNDIDVRLKYHNSGYVKSTAADRPWRFVALEKVESKDEARWLERSLKKSRGKRIRWIAKNQIKPQATPRREGAARSGPKEFIRFINIAQGSLSEIDTQIELCKTLNYINNIIFNEIQENLTLITK